MIRLEITRKKWVKYKLFLSGQSIDEYLSQENAITPDYEENGFYTIFDDNVGVEQGQFTSFLLDEAQSLYILTTKSDNIYYFPIEVTIVVEKIKSMAN